MEDNKFNLDDFDCNFAKEKYTPELEIQVRDDGYVSFIPDPDTESFKLVACHQAAWSNKIINQKTRKVMELKMQKKRVYDHSHERMHDYYDLIWGDFTFTSDIIVTDISRYKAARNLINQIIADSGLEQYKSDATKRTNDFYTGIGNFIIFPKTCVLERPTINTIRGGYPFYDRFDLALEYIRTYYQRKNEKGYNNGVIDEKIYEKVFNTQDNNDRLVNQDFFDSFENFQGYINFFCLQDWVSNDFSQVRDLVRSKFVNGDWVKKCWISEESFASPLPNKDTYQHWIDNQIALTQRRTQKIKDAYQKKQK